MQETLKNLRINAGKRIVEVAAVLGVAISTYYNYEEGVRRISLEQVLLLSKLFDRSAEEVIKAHLNSCPKVQ